MYQEICANDTTKELFIKSFLIDMIQLMHHFRDILMHSTAHTIRTSSIGGRFIGAVHARNLSLHPSIERVSIVEPNGTGGTKTADRYRATWVVAFDFQTPAGRTASPRQAW
jgi:hypothetical protein